MKHSKVVVLAGTLLAVAAVLVFPLGNGVRVSAHTGNLTINTALTFGAIDGNVTYDADGVNGTLLVNGNLTLANGGSITANSPASPTNAPAGAITIVVNGDMEMDNSSAITAESLGNSHGDGGAITITVTGNFTMHTGTVISSSVTTGTTGDTHGGNITINVGNCSSNPTTGTLLTENGSTIKADNFGHFAGGTISLHSCHDMDIDGPVRSQSNGSGAGDNHGHGGYINLSANCSLTVSQTGQVESIGLDPGADLVHLQSCDVLVSGLVESTGSGHATPSNPPTHLVPPFRPDKPADSTAGVEIWAGNSLTIDATGEVNADTGVGGGGVSGIGWVDLFCRGNINIMGNSSAPFAVHADGVDGSGGNGENGGIVTVKSTTGKVTLTGLAISASAPNAQSNSDGGSVSVQASMDVALGTSTILATGNDHAGTISVRSFNGFVTGSTPGVLDTTGDASTLGGGIFLQGCGTGAPNDGVNYTGTTDANTIATTPDACGGAPDLTVGFNGVTISYVSIPPCNNCAPVTTTTSPPTTTITTTTSTNPPPGIPATSNWGMLVVFLLFSLGLMVMVIRISSKNGVK